MSFMDSFTGPLKTARRAIIALLVMQAMTLAGLGAAVYFAFQAATRCA